MTLPELVAATIREVLRTYADMDTYGAMAGAKGWTVGPALNELARLFSIDMEALIKEVS